MRNYFWIRTLFLILALLLLPVACGDDEAVATPTPTLAPTAVVPATGTPAAAASVDTPVPPTATAEPITAVSAAAIDWPPQVIYTSPAPGEQVVLNGAITIRFDQPMDQASVEGAFMIEPADGEAQQVAGEFSWPRPDTVVFTPSGELQRKQTYRLRLGETAKSQKGLPLAVPLDTFLETAGFLQVSQVIPADSTAAVAADAAITVLFNRPVAPLVSTGQQADLPQPLRFEPPVDGTGEWVSTSIYRFTPDVALAGATTYQAVVTTDFADITGNGLAEPYRWQFTTQSPAVVAVEPPNNTALFDPTAPLSITFNMPMERASTETAVSVRYGGGNNVALSYNWSDADRVLTLTPLDSLPLATAFQIGVAERARSANGAANLNEATLSGFSTVPFPAVVETQPAAGQQTERWQRGFRVDFAAPMDWSTLEGRIKIDPAPERVRYNFYETQLYADFELAINTEYEVTIPGDAADPYGNWLGADYTWTFTTPPGAPLASFNLPQQVAQLSTSFATEVEIIHRNVSRLDVALFDVGLPLNLIGQPYNVNDYRPAANPLRSWSQEVATPPETADLAALNLADGGTLPTGVYLLTLSSPETGGEDVGWWQNQRNLLILADTNVVVKEMFGEAHVWVTDLGSGQPVSGLSLVAYNEQGGEIGTAVSDDRGFASFTLPPVDYLPGITVVSNRPGESGFGIGRSVWNVGAEGWDFGLDSRSDAPAPVFAYIYTDRPIYRPGDTLYFKGIVRQPNYGRYNLPALETVTLQLQAAGFQQENSLDETIEVELDPLGTFNGEYVIPEDINLGAFQLSLRGQDYNAYRQFTVAEYRTPEFLITLTPDKAEVLRGEAVDVTLEATYFFGGPAADLPVSWNLYDSAYVPQPDGPFYYFADGGDFFYQQSGPFGFGGGGSLGDYINNGAGRTDENGRLSITLPAELVQDMAQGSRAVTVEATISDLAEFPVTSRTELVFHAAELYAGVRPVDYLGTAGQESEVELLTLDWDGAPVSDQTVEVTFYRREWERERTQSFGIYYTDWTPVDTEVARQTVQTDGQGQGVAGFTPASGGSYLVTAEVTDDRGNTYLSSTSLWVIDGRFGGWRTDPKARRMDLVPDQESYEPGDTANILVQSPFDGPVQAWLTIERGTLIEQRLVTLPSSSEVVAIPITADYAPNVYVSLTAVKPVRPDDVENPYADIRLGIAELVVDPGQLALNLALSPRQTLFQPRDTAVYDITVTDYAGSPVQAELSLALVDLAVLTLKEDNAPPIMDAFYSRQPYRSRVGAGLFISGEGLEAEIPIEAGGFGGGGGGDGLAQLAQARAPGDDEDVRRDFPDTAFWRANVTTDATGQATVEIPLPDSLTTWRLSSKAITADSRVGQTSTDVVVTLPLLLRPSTPRFFTAGDQVQIAANVNNTTDTAIEAAVWLEEDGLTFAGPAEQTVTVPAHGRVVVEWPVTVEDVEYVDMTFRVEGGGFSDATKPTISDDPDGLIPVYRYDAEDIVGTSGSLDEAGRRVEAILLPPGVDTRRGTVDVALSPSLAAAMVTALQSNNNRVGTVCASSLSDRLLSNAVTLQAVERLALGQPDLQAELVRWVTGDIDRLQNLARPDGGWGWCFSQESDPWLSAYALLALAQAEAAGYGVDGAVRAAAVAYLADQLTALDQLTDSYQVNREAFFLYVLAQAGEDASRGAALLLDAHRELLDPYAKALLLLTFAAAGELGVEVDTLLSDLNNSAVVSATGAHWEDGNTDTRNLGSDVRGTAIVVAALSRLDAANPWLPPAIRWLMTARTAQYWASSHETAWSILALTEWLAASGELDANYEYLLNVNLETAVEGSFSQANLLETEEVAVPVADLALEQVNFLDFQRGLGDGRLYYTIHLNSFIDAAQVEAVSRGITVQRRYYDAACDPETADCEPLAQVDRGQQVRVELTIIAENDLLYAQIEDPLPSGAEGIDPNLETSASGLGPEFGRADTNYRYGYWGWWYFNRIEFRDEKVSFFADYLPAGTYQYTYYMQANISGTFQVMPATARQAFFPEVFGRSEGMLFTIAE